MPRCTFTDGKHISFELMMQQAPHGYDPIVETEKQNNSHVQSKKKHPRIEKEVIKDHDVG
jgi:hypothetical protein